jgi:hypothetical protein
MEAFSSDSFLLVLYLLEMYVMVSVLTYVIGALWQSVIQVIARDLPCQILVLGPSVNSGSAQSYTKEEFFDYISKSMESVNKDSVEYVFKVAFNPAANLSSLTVSREQPTPNAQEHDNSCVVCLDRAPTHAFVPCGHMVCCEECVGRLTQCPMCRIIASHRLKVYRQ